MVSEFERAGDSRLVIVGMDLLMDAASTIERLQSAVNHLDERLQELEQKREPGR
jgi:ubiquinone biosynthesis protein UbiJ